jgi:molybdenum cofactor biosynthesis protein B
MSEVAELHKAHAPHSLGIFIVTCSTSRFNELRAGKKIDDASGDIIERLLTNAGHRIEGRRLISDSKTMIRTTAKQVLASKNVDALIITGGTGLSPRDVTIESVITLLHREIPGFGELFRKVSYDKIGSPAMLTRAIAGLINGKAVFCLPGSPDAVQTALEKLILPELGHIIRVGREH